ncbi:hypothetical protein MMC20_007203 [Loxospora ochrophaea]|nr:hypothetical protein [Loxospora ochrophaea]
MDPSQPQPHSRTFHDTQVEYNLPNDSIEHARLEDQAAGYTELMHGKLVHAPLQSPANAFDVGCGTGVMTRHLGTLYPAAAVYGIDISPVPPYNPTPPNVSYIKGDIRSLAKTDNRLVPGTLDYIYNRLLVCGMTKWPAYVQEIATLLRPRGWMEIHDYTYEWWKNGEACDGDWQWMKAMRKGASQKGLDLDCGRNAKQYMEQAGLVDVAQYKYQVPCGTWMVKDKPETRRIGEHQAGDLIEVISQAILPGVVRDLGLTEQELGQLKEECSTCLQAEEDKYMEFYVTVGRKT